MQGLRQRGEGGEALAQNFHALPAHQVHQLELSLKSCESFYLRVLWCRHNWLTHLSLVIELNL